ncbi:hypothetical protein M1N21_00025 [Dehalococcoidia bacterium]|nr:hypothetical protein [Dehalococcoidia bacterium]MCL0064477.1 hypothetical protein [Dehalococcoidia bacterium]
MNGMISSVVTIASALTEEVHLKRDFLNAEANDRRLRGYIPPRSARAAIRGILEGFHPTSQMRVHLITGTYGTGKSHFGLVLANLVSRDIDDPALQVLLAKLGQKDEHLVNSIKRTREATKRYMVVLPEPYWDPEGFNHSLLASLAEALQRKGVDFEPPTVFRAALDCIDSWRMNDADAYQKFEDSCLRHSKTAEMLIDELTSYKEAGYSLFKEIHKEVAHGARFVPELTADPARIYDETIKHLRSTGEWQGIFIFYDEFSRYLSHMAEDPDAFEGQQLQSFAEYCKRTGENQCHLVVIAHQTLQDYARGKRSQEEWSKIYGRFLSGDYLLAVAGGEHEMEEIIGSILVQQRAGDPWKQLSAHADFNILADLIQDVGLYPAQNRSWIESQLIQGCYPLHPYATFCLPWVANYVVRQRERTLFTFFGRPSEEGLQNFIEKHTVLLPDNRLNLYTADRLFDYYREQVRVHPDYRYIVNAAENALALCGDSPLGTRAVKIIAILAVVNHPQLSPTQRTIMEALHISPSQEKEVAQVLTELVNRRALRFRPVTKRYELPGRPGMIDAREAIDKAKQALLAGGFDLKNYLNTSHAIPVIEAHGYSDKHFTKRYATCQFISVSDLSNPKTYLDRIRTWYEPDRGKYEGDALVLYVVADSITDINNAQEHLKQGACKHPQLVIAIPKTPAPFGEMAIELAAIQRIRQQDLRTDEGEIDSDDLAGIETDAKEGMRSGMRDFLQAGNLTWYWDGNVVTNLPQGGEDEFISQVLEAVFSKTPHIKDEAIANPITATDRSKKDRWIAMDTLLQVKGPFQLRKKGGPASDRILRACLRDVELLERVSDKGSVEELEVRDKAPANSELKEVWDFLNKQVVTQGGKVTPATEVVRPLIEPPYGLTNQEVEILLAAFLRNRREDTVVFGNFKEAARVQKPDPLNPCVPLNGQDVTNLVRDPTDFVIYYYEVSPKERDYINGIVRLTGADEESLASYRGWERARNALLSWYGDLPSVTKSASDFENARCQPMLEVLAKLEKASQAREILQRDLPTALGIDVTAPEFPESTFEQTLDSLEDVVAELNGYAQAKGSKLLAEIGAIFGAEGDTQEEVAEAVKNWYKALNEAQRMHSFGGDEGHIIRAAREEAPVVQRMLNMLPQNMGLKSFPEWEADNSDLFLAKLKLAKQGIESWTPRAKPGGPESEDAQKTLRARTQIMAILKELNLPKSVQIEVLSSLLEELEK